MGAAGRPRELFGPERMTYAPPFYACAMSFTKYLVERSDLARVIGLIEKLPDGITAVQAEIERITGQPVPALRNEWQRKIGVRAADGWGGMPLRAWGLARVRNLSSALCLTLNATEAALLPRLVCAESS